MAKTILSTLQIDILKFLAKQRIIQDQFYFGGGTVLSECYLHHRLSEDLDFFSDTEFDPQQIAILAKKLKQNFPIKNIEYRQQFHRNLYFFEFPAKEIIKMEFTYFPFERIDGRGRFMDISIDSLLDISVNKLHTIIMQPRSRDFIDLYLVLKKKLWGLEELLKYVRIKYDTSVDYAHLGKQFLLVSDVKDYPNMIIPLPPEKWKKFFLDLAMSFENKILK